MDVKAMARSKRSHTKHHQPRKPNRPNTQSTPSSSPNDPKVVKAEGEKKRSNLGNSLPSNWDRYDDSDEDEALFGSESESALDADAVKPKSKGADFAFLISEAKSQSPAKFSDSLDDIVPDFFQGLGSMLSSRGENILSWTGGDNFLMEDEANTNQEVPFLSLNMKTLAEDLARIDLAQRLFIEDAVLPPELLVPQKIGRQNKMPISTCVEQRSEVDDLAFHNSSKVGKGTASNDLSLRQERQLDDILADHKADSLRVSDPKRSFKASQEAEMENKIPGFEAELDMLLGSFDETRAIGSSNTDSNVPSNNVTNKKTSASSFPANNMDNDIDNLLEATSNISVDTGKQLSSSSHPGTKSKVMEDFDSWLDTI